MQKYMKYEILWENAEIVKQPRHGVEIKANSPYRKAAEEIKIVEFKSSIDFNCQGPPITC